MQFVARIIFLFVAFALHSHEKQAISSFIFIATGKILPIKTER